MHKYKSLKYPGKKHEIDMIQRAYCLANNDNCFDIPCSKCLFYESNMDQFEDWYKNNVKL